jgi:3-deoxy-D-manno-octulosonate 8-phosphate phosphatase (KDO 8-P phosphatase)
VLILRKERNEEELLKCVEEFTQKLKLDNYFAGVITQRNDDELTKKLALIDNCIVVTSSFNKVGSVEVILKKLNLEMQNVLYIGDDMLDIPLLQQAGVAIAPSSARREVKRVVDFTIEITVNGSILHSVLKMIEELSNE